VTLAKILLVDDDHLPTAAKVIVRIKAMTGSWSAAELPHRVSQKFVEQGCAATPTRGHR
jgi:hypothetical protein